MITTNQKVASLNPAKITKKIIQNWMVFLVSRNCLNLKNALESFERLYKIKWSFCF